MTEQPDLAKLVAEITSAYVSTHQVEPGRLPDIIADVRRALAATRRERPADAYAFFVACLGRRVSGEVAQARRGIPALKHSDDLYGS